MVGGVFLQSVRISDPHLVATFDEGYTNATLFSSMELISTKPLPTNVTVMVNVSIDMEEDGVCLIEHLATQEIVLNADATILYPFPPVCLSIQFFWCFSSCVLLCLDCVVNH
jgi:mannosylglycoprotein endo-beta-mannosidase